ncbi:jg22276 [Pararge aegeria aegeria]|uniref:Jg22276 protein n=1 Tax=Pararge aegeria aegeria TaxID=348720 RepID=A0A8S4RL36_9NEOP|nr:jg22276 [Pararge aegeria aegeria]
METDWMIEDSTTPKVTSLTSLDTGVRPAPSGAAYVGERNTCLTLFSRWNETDQVEFVEQLLARMCHYQHGHINAYLKPMLQRDFISMLPNGATRSYPHPSTLYRVRVSSLNEKGLRPTTLAQCGYVDYTHQWRALGFLPGRINCRSENSKGVYCLQYDDNKIVSGLRDNTIKIWDRKTLQCVKATSPEAAPISERNVRRGYIAEDQFGVEYKD